MMQLQNAILHSRSRNLLCIFFLWQAQVLRRQDEKNSNDIIADEDDYGDVYDDRGLDTDAHGQLLDKIDAYSFRIFPIVFFISNIPFWCYYAIFSPAECS